MPETIERYNQKDVNNGRTILIKRTRVARANTRMVISDQFMVVYKLYVLFLKLSNLLRILGKQYFIFQYGSNVPHRRIPLGFVVSGIAT